MKGGYDYVLLQEGPTYALESSLNYESREAAKESAFQPFKYKEFLTTSIKNNEGGDSSGDASGASGASGVNLNLDIVTSEITDDTKFFGEFYLVVNTNTVSVQEIKSLGFLIRKGKEMFSNDEAIKVFNTIIGMVEKQ
jgi:hypothetical protein